MDKKISLTTAEENGRNLTISKEDSKNEDHYVSFSDLVECAGEVTNKTILEWVKHGVLLSAEMSGYVKGIRGKQAWYKVENINRIKTINWFRDYFQKNPSSTLGLEGLKHLLFIFGFKSPEIYHTEKQLILQGKERLTKEIPNFDWFMDMDKVDIIKDTDKVIGSFMDFLKIENVAVKIGLMVMARNFINKQKYNLSLDFIHLLEVVDKFNEKGLEKLQKGLLFIMFPLLFDVGNYPGITTNNIPGITPKGIENINKITQMLPVNDTSFKKFIVHLIKPEMAVTFPLIFLGVRYFMEQHDDYYDFNITEDDFTDNEYQMIENPFKSSFKHARKGQ